MKYVGIARHTESAFNEESATRLLADFLEQKRTIKTFFKENDRTPNYDGSFELVGPDRAPTKQFIVQIKKVQNLTQNIKGDNKGKYMYSLETNFLYYIKEKVTESPAIYFVVDIATKNIFWLYLSDELLMNLNFEGKATVSYAFQESDIINDLDTFVCTLYQIAQKRNSLFLNKTPQQIAEMQDALDYINRLMDNDFVKIKEALFPNLWRFGIRHSHSSSFSIIAGDKTVTADDTVLFALYPQIKGVADTGLQEYTRDESSMFNRFDMNGKITPMEYTQDTLYKIIKTYFEKGIPFSVLPNIALFEKLDILARKMERYYEFQTEDGKILIDDLFRGCSLLLRYIQNILLSEPADTEELRLKQSIVANYNRGNENFLDIISEVYFCIPSFKQFCQQYVKTSTPRFSPNLFDIIQKEYIRDILILLELKERGVKFLDRVWDYDYFELIQLDGNEFINTVDGICEKWFSLLPELYSSIYGTLFDKNKYRFKGKFEYKNIYCSNGLCGPYLSNIIREYQSNDFSATHNPNCSKNFDDADKALGLKSVRTGLVFERFLPRKTLFYDALHCLLYQGICDGLSVESERLTYDGQAFKLF